MNKNFDEDYFGGYYKRNVGNFTKKDLEKSINWFTGWFKFLQRFVDFEKGKGKKVLEIGCSIGGASSILAERGFKIYASDISSFALAKASKLAKESGREINFYKFDIQKEIPIKEKFDFIIAFEVIEHLSNPLKAIRNMRSKLGTNGVIVCSTPDKNYDMSSDPTHINVKTKEDWIKIFNEVGFNKVITSYVSFLPFFYNINKNLHFTFPFPVRSKFINSPLFILAWK